MAVTAGCILIAMPISMEIKHVHWTLRLGPADFLFEALLLNHLPFYPLLTIVPVHLR